jgi:hypothetical protein
MALFGTQDGLDCHHSRNTISSEARMLFLPQVEFTWKTPIKFVGTGIIAIIVDLFGGGYLLSSLLTYSQGTGGLWVAALLVIVPNLGLAAWLTYKRQFALAAGIAVGLVLVFVAIPTVIVPAMMQALSTTF